MHVPYTSQKMSLADELAYTTATELAARIRRRELSPVEVIDATRDEIAAELGKQNAVVLSHGYYPYNYVYTSKDVQTVADLEGVKIRSHSTVLSDMLSGVGAIGTFVAFSEVYGALERGVVQGAVASVDGAFNAHWYEVTSYMTGPVNALALTWLTINQDLFESMDDGLQALILAEGIHREKQVIIGVFRDTPKFALALKDKGMVERPWPAGAVAKLKDASVSLDLPGWVKTVSYTHLTLPTSDLV